MRDWELLNVEPDATVGELRLRWRNLALVIHPDHGGDVGKFIQLNQAYQRLLMKAKRCRHCRDTGTAKRQVGFESITVVCRCKGGVG